MCPSPDTVSNYLNTSMCVLMTAFFFALSAFGSFFIRDRNEGVIHFSFLCHHGGPHYKVIGEDVKDDCRYKCCIVM